MGTDFPEGLTGAELARRAAVQAERFGTEIVATHRSVKRVASAVGEGAMAVQFVRQYFAEG